MFKNLRFLLLANSTLGKIISILRPKSQKGLKNSKMNLTVNSSIQVLALILAFSDQVTQILPAEYKLWGYVAISAIQGITSVLAHFKNPDGSPATTPYTPPSTLK